MKKNVTVTFDINIEVDETKFTNEYMETFRKYFYEFETIEEHIQHLAKLEARWMLEDSEGYDIRGMGIKAQIMNVETEIED